MRYFFENCSSTAARNTLQTVSIKIPHQRSIVPVLHIRITQMQHILVLVKERQPLIQRQRPLHLTNRHPRTNTINGSNTVATVRPQKIYYSRIHIEKICDAVNINRTTNLYHHHCAPKDTKTRTFDIYFISSIRNI